MRLSHAVDTRLRATTPKARRKNEPASLERVSRENWHSYYRVRVGRSECSGKSHEFRAVVGPPQETRLEATSKK